MGRRVATQVCEPPPVTSSRVLYYIEDPCAVCFEQRSCRLNAIVSLDCNDARTTLTSHGCLG